MKNIKKKRILSEEHKIQIGKSNKEKRKGKTWEEIFGFEWTQKRKKALCLENKNRIGVMNGTWSGDNPTYGALHQWIRKKLGRSMKCEKCGKIETSYKKMHWANRSGKYLRDLNDWIRLCVSCHKIFDNNFYGRHKKKLKNTKI
jgi:hypothetical protein